MTYINQLRTQYLFLVLYYIILYTYLKQIKWKKNLITYQKRLKHLKLI